MSYYIYILTNKRNGTLYIGVTNNLERRIYEHIHKIIPGFTEKYDISQLVYFEETIDVNAALTREKQLKKWSRKWKLELIEKSNPQWKDLSCQWYDPGSPLSRG
ncbi:MAG: GIY-YIG nuclease family protein [Patescibacteria group bacterium]